MHGHEMAFGWARFDEYPVLSIVLQLPFEPQIDTRINVVVRSRDLQIFFV